MTRWWKNSWTHCGLNMGIFYPQTVVDSATYSMFLSIYPEVAI